MPPAPTRGILGDSSWHVPRSPAAMRSTRSSAAGTLPHVTTAREYLAAERDAETLHILWEGEVFEAMGATPAHNAIVAAVLRELGVRLRRTACQPFASQQRVKIPLRDCYVYPDASVICGAMETDPLDEDTALNPRLIVEVLSPSTESFDRGAKWIGYQSIPSLTDYLLLLQSEPRVEHFARQADGGWLLHAYGPGKTLRVDTLDVELAVDDIYEGVLTLS